MKNKYKVVNQGFLINMKLTDQGVSVGFFTGNYGGLLRSNIICEIWKTKSTPGWPDQREHLLAYGIAIKRDFDAFDELTGCKVALKKALQNTELNYEDRRRVWDSLFELFLS